MFQSSNSPLGAGLKMVAAGDIDKDGKIDLVALRQTEIDILYNEGNNQFSAPALITLPSLEGSGAIALTDINRDGFLEIATHNSTVSVAALKSKGARQFEKDSTGKNLWTKLSFARYFHYVGNPVNAFATIRPDSQGRGGFVVANSVDGFLQNDSVQIVHSAALTTGGSPTMRIDATNGTDFLNLGVSANALAVGQFDGDAANRDDLAVLLAEAVTISILTGGVSQPSNTYSTLVPSASYPTGSSAQSTGIAAGDLNLDGFDDVVTSNGTALSISILTSHPNGTGLATLDGGRRFGRRSRCYYGERARRNRDICELYNAKILPITSL